MWELKQKKIHGYVLLLVKYNNNVFGDTANVEKLCIIPQTKVNSPIN